MNGKVKKLQAFFQQLTHSKRWEAMTGCLVTFCGYTVKKLKYFVLGPIHIRDSLFNHIVNLDDVLLAFSTTVRNLGVISVNEVSFISQVKQISGTVFFHLHNIFKIQHFLPQQAAERLVKTLDSEDAGLLMIPRI